MIGEAKYPVVPLKDLVFELSSRNRDDSGLPIYSVTNSDGFVPSVDYFKKQVFSKDTSNYKKVPPGAFAYNPSRVNVGSLDYLRLDSQVLVSPLYIVFGTSEVLHPPYLKRFLLSEVGLKQINHHTQGAVRDSLKFSGLKKIEIPLPPLDEQKRIAAVLDKADALRRQRQESLQLTEKLLQSVFIDMFGEPVTNPKGWYTLPLEELCEKIVDCPHSTPVYSDTATGFFCVRSSDIQNGKLELASTRHVSESIFMERIARHEPKAGEVVYTREGGRLGFAAQVPQEERVCLGQRMMLFKAKEKVSTNTFLANLLNSESFRRKVLNLVGGGAAPRVNIKDLRTIVVYQPPFELQERFETFAASLQNEEKLLAQSADQTRRLFSSLQQRAFRGELDLSRLRLEEDVEALERAVDKLQKVVHATLPKALCPSPSVPQPSTATPSPRCAPSFPSTVPTA